MSNERLYFPVDNCCERPFWYGHHKTLSIDITDIRFDGQSFYNHTEN